MGTFFNYRFSLTKRKKELIKIASSMICETFLFNFMVFNFLFYHLLFIPADFLPLPKQNQYFHCVFNIDERVREKRNDLNLGNRYRLLLPTHFLHSFKRNRTLMRKRRDNNQITSCQIWGFKYEQHHHLSRHFLVVSICGCMNKQRIHLGEQFDVGILYSQPYFTHTLFMLATWCFTSFTDIKCVLGVTLHLIEKTTQAELVYIDKDIYW